MNPALLYRRLGSAFERVPVAVQGAVYMTLATLLFSAMNLIIRLASEHVHPLEIPFFRNLFALLFMLPWAYRSGVSVLRTRQLKMHGMRALVGVASMFAWFSAVSLLPLAEAVALSFTAPLFVTIGAALLLGEVVRARRWTATLIGFLGTLVVLRPGIAEVTWLTLLPISAALLMAGSMLCVKVLARTEPPAVIVFYMGLLMTPLSLIPALAVWRWPSPTAWGLFVLLGLIAAVSHIFFTRAFAKCDASAVQPFDYMRLPFVALLGFLFFGEVPSGWIWLGGAMIAGSAIYIARREAQISASSRATS
ncbi:MAG: RNA polymerase subunit sigma-54 [Thiotrichales bacterium]|nr:RNA polymerase subunit sigma-54 [Thiotrichales bacterium]